MGVLLAGVPAVAFNFWLSGVIERQGHQEVESLARRTMVLAESRIVRAVTSIEELAKRGVDSCRPAHIELLRQASFDNPVIRQFAVVNAEGQILCTDLGPIHGQRSVVTAQRLPSNERLLLEVVRFVGRDEPMVRIRRPGTANANGLAALLWSELFIARVGSNGGPTTTRSIMTTDDGTVIAEGGDAEAEGSENQARFATKRRSDKYGLNVSISLPRDFVSAGHTDLHDIGMVMSGIISLVILGFALLIPKGQADNPVTELRRALNAGEFVPYYQPVVDITNGKLRGAEVLVRWRKPDGTLVLPGGFIPLMESSDLIKDLSRALMRKACVDLAEAYDARPHLRIGFNIAACHIANESIVTDVREIFENSKVRLSQVILELTERQPIDDLTETRRVIAALQGLGVRIALDDVGAGHSGLSYILKLGVDSIKIDKMFIDAIGTDNNSATIVETLIDLAGNLRMDVIAEGIETFEQVVRLRELGVRAGQGYVFAPALPGSSFLQLVEAIDPLTVALDEQPRIMPQPRYAAARNRSTAA